MFTLLNLICFITLILLIWFKSDALIEWGKFSGLSKFLKTEEFYEKRLVKTIEGYQLNYPDFLKEKYNYNFIVKMLSCPLCLSVWLSTIICIFISIIWSSLFILMSIPVVICSSLLIYGIISFLLK